MAEFVLEFLQNWLGAITPGNCVLALGVLVLTLFLLFAVCVFPFRLLHQLFGGFINGKK